MNMSAPWISYYHKLVALFGEDPDIKINFEENTNTIRFYVEGQNKAEALEKLLPAEKEFGTMKIFTEIIPANEKLSNANLFRNAFEGNPLYEDMIIVRPEGSSNPFTYMMFKKQVVQYWDDNLGDPHGNISTLAQNIAQEIFRNTEGVYFCTENE